MVRLKLGVDIGGTFTDFVLVNEDTGEIAVAKVLTTPADPSIAVLDGAEAALKDLGVGWDTISLVSHGTTLVTNAVIERKGAKTAMVTTKGFRDILSIRTERRYDIYDIFLDFPDPVVPRYLTREVTERVLSDGTLRQPLDRDEAAQAVRDLLDEGVESIAVCFLHSYANPAHEQEMASVIDEMTGGDVFVSLSSDVLPELREYFRASTTTVNAYVQPVVKRYLERLESGLTSRGLRGGFYLMQSNGGTSSVTMAKIQPVRLLESGPAAGALAATFIGKLCDTRDLLSFDMGGTTAKLCLIRDSTPSKTNNFEAARLHRFKPGSGIPVKIPVIDLIEIGAGGGSIATIDELGLLKVGPESSGADPGPACYGLGGTLPTVSDADLVLGYLNPDYFLGGDMALVPENAYAAIERHLTGTGELTTVEAAWGVHRVVNEQMALAAKMHIIEKGYDPRKHAMVAFGGAGPVHAYGVARILKLPRIIYPPAAGAASAVGLLVAPISFDLVQTHKAFLQSADLEALNEAYERLEQQGREMLRTAGVSDDEIEFIRTADMRYLGQGYEIDVPIPNGDLTEAERPTIQENFNASYDELYGRLTPDVPSEFVSLRVVARGREPTLTLQPPTTRGSSLQDAARASRQAYFDECGGFVECDVYDRYTLPVGVPFSGPAIIEEREATTVLGPAARCVVDEYGNLLVDLVDSESGLETAKRSPEEAHVHGN